jgi:hypothetical protein
VKFPGTRRKLGPIRRWWEQRAACPQIPLRYGVGVVPYPPGGKQSRHASVSASPRSSSVLAIIYCNGNIDFRWLECYLRLLTELQCKPTLFNGY